MNSGCSTKMKKKQREQKRKREEKEKADKRRGEEKEAIEEERKEKIEKRKREEQEEEEKRRMEEIEPDESELEEYLKTKVSTGSIRQIHMSGNTNVEEVIVQVYDTKIQENTVVSGTLSDGEFVTHNVKPRGEKVAVEMMKFEKFEVINVKKASVKGDTIILDKIEVVEFKDENDVSAKIKKLIKADGVEKLKPHKRTGFSAHELKIW